ncbi:hypothetical protein ACS0TY_011444 [Phlomoides rotata]
MKVVSAGEINQVFVETVVRWETPSEHIDPKIAKLKVKPGYLLSANTITNIVIPAFDIKLLQPARRSALLDAKFSDICISTSAAPTFLPGHEFFTKDEIWNIQREYNLIDGGVAANNPTLIAITEVTKQRFDSNMEEDLNPRLLTISIGTGNATTDDKRYDIKRASKWGILDWIIT